jgi:hypothetical protein
VRVYTFKEGLLSAVGHDLCFEAENASVEFVPGRSCRAVVPVASLRVVCAMISGQPDLSVLSEKDKRDIDANLRRYVLPPDRFPEALFEGKNVGNERIVGQLTLAGQRHEIDVSVMMEAERWVTRFSIDQRTWGIKPFRALLGALKVKPEVRVEVVVPVRSVTRTDG